MAYESRYRKKVEGKFSRDNIDDMVQQYLVNMRGFSVNTWARVEMAWGALNGGVEENFTAVGAHSMEKKRHALFIASSPPRSP